MAHSQESWDNAKALFMKGDSLSVISKETGISRGQIGKKANKEGWGKETITTLAKAEIENTIIGNEIKRQKETLNDTERDTYNNVFISLSSHLNLFNSSTIENQHIVNKAQQAIRERVDNNIEEAIEHLPNIMAISKVTETNRKQLYGVTETFKQNNTDTKETKTGVGELYKAINE